MAIEQTRHALLEATLPHVPFDGWTGAAVTAGARNLGLSPAEVANAFPGGPIEMIELMSLEADQRMTRCDSTGKFRKIFNNLIPYITPEAPLIPTISRAESALSLILSGS